MKEIIFSSEEKALQHLADITNKKIVIASEIFGDTISAMDTINMMKKNKFILFLYDQKTGKFEKKKSPGTHTELAEKMTGDEEDQDRIVDKGVRGYHFPKLNLITFYQVNVSNRYRNPEKSALSIAIHKLKAKDDVEVKIINDKLSASF